MKILIAEDNQNNLGVAKSFFSKISGYNFIYVMDRKSAEEKLSESSGLITTQIMFYNKSIRLDPILEVFKCGEILLTKAQLCKKPVVILSDSGSFINEKDEKLRGKFIELWGTDICKQNMEAWKLAWENLLLQFKRK